MSRAAVKAKKQAAREAERATKIQLERLAREALIWYTYQSPMARIAP
jgi:hypothetical protein